MKPGQRVHWFGTLGTIVDFDDYHQERAMVSWDSGSSETVPTKELRPVTAEMEATLKSGG